MISYITSISMLIISHREYAAIYEIYKLQPFIIENKVTLSSKYMECYILAGKRIITRNRLESVCRDIDILQTQKQFSMLPLKRKLAPHLFQHLKFISQCNCYLDFSSHQSTIETPP